MAQKDKRIVYASQTGNLTSACVINVELSKDEEVEWQWTHFPNGQSVITGYKILKKDKLKVS
ncbi:MAG: hypothetical protein ACR9NN_17690 [Nostochopsis sp.]